MKTEQFSAQALALKARADGATTVDERVAIIRAIHRLVRSVPASFEIPTKTTLFALVDTLTASMGSGTK